MNRKSKIWFVLAVLFFGVNLAGLVYAAILGEGPHAGLHAVLLIPGAYLLSRLAPWRSARADGRHDASGAVATEGELAQRLTHLEQTLDAASIAVERIGEGQRFMTRVFAEPSMTRMRDVDPLHAGDMDQRDPSTASATGKAPPRA